MLSEFRAFISRGNVVDLAVAVIIGAAFGRIITSFTDDIIMPVIGRIFGGLDFANYFIRLGDIPADFKGSVTSYVDLKAAGVPLLGYGQFVTVAVNFLIVAFIVFLVIRAINRAMPRAEAASAAEPAEVTLLREIRDELKLERGRHTL
jgi:large conductance mechanosensitive channel